MRRIVEEQIPPPTYVRRDYLPALELIVMKALEQRPVDRHQSAAELQHELNEFMEEAGLKSGSRRLSQYRKELFTPQGGAGVSPEGAAVAERAAFGDASEDVSEVTSVLHSPPEAPFPTVRYAARRRSLPRDTCRASS